MTDHPSVTLNFDQTCRHCGKTVRYTNGQREPHPCADDTPAVTIEGCGGNTPLVDRVEQAMDDGDRLTGRSFATYLTAYERDQLDARAACAEQERDDALADLQAARAELDRVRDQRDRLVADLTDAGNEVDQLTADNTRLQADLARVTAELDVQLTADNTRLQADLARVTAELDVVRTTAEEMTRAVKRLVPERDEARAERDQAAPLIAAARHWLATGDSEQLHKAIHALPAAVPGSPPRAQEPQPGQFCAHHWSWLCQAGRGRCQADRAAVQPPATPDTRDETGRERGCTCSLTGPATAPRIAEIDTQCPLHGRLVAVDAHTEEDHTDA